MMQQRAPVSGIRVLFLTENERKRGVVSDFIVNSLFMRNQSFSPRRIWRWLLRFRHRCGYGIQSPFAFSFVTGVVYERGMYYAYDPLSREARRNRSPLREKDDRLLLRLANASRATWMLVAGPVDSLSLSYLQAGRRCFCKEVRDVSVRTLEKALQGREAPGLVYAAPGTVLDEVVRTVLPHAGDRTMLVLAGIYASQASREAWRRLKADSRVRVTFDLYDFGIAFFQQRLNKQNYIVNYF